MDIDALLLARLQFGFTIAFHIVFPALSIGLVAYLVTLEALWLRTANTVYRDLYHFWTKVFALTFGMGVVSGVVMAYQFGTNWSFFTDFAGAITGSLLAYEVLTAFALEAGFLGVMLFGWNRVGPGLHFMSTLLVCIGTLISTSWILASNSWMQTPAGFEIVDGRAVPTDWLAVIFNPSFPYRLAHMTTGAFLAAALLVGASGAWHLLRGRDNPLVRKMFAMAMGFVLVVAPLQAAIGDAHGRNTLEHQPAKIAAIEGHWHNEPGQGVPLIVFGLPDMEREQTRFALEIPRLGSLILTHSWDGQIRGLRSFAPEDRPNATIIFWTFRVMVGLGMLMIALGLWAAWARWRNKLYTSRWLLRFALCMGPAGVLAILAGWFTTEIGRQPWVVYGLMRTADAATPHALADMALTLALFVIVYVLVFGAGAVYVLRVIAQGPLPPENSQPAAGGPGEAKHAMRPLSAAVAAQSPVGPA